MTSVNITGWHPERILGFVEAIKGDHPCAVVEAVIRHRDPDRQGQLSLSLSHDEPTDLVARRCQQCGTVTLSEVVSLDALDSLKTLSPGDEHDDETKRTHDRRRNGNGQH